MRNAPPQQRTLALKPKLRSWTGRIWRATPTNFQLMLKLDASLAVSEIEDADLRAALSPHIAELSSFALYSAIGSRICRVAERGILPTMPR